MDYLNKISKLNLVDFYRILHPMIIEFLFPKYLLLSTFQANNRAEILYLV